MTKRKKLKNLYLPTLIFIITICLFIPNSIKFISNLNNNLNLNLKEVDTLYENSDSYDLNNYKLISYVDTSWKWPTEDNYYLTTQYSNYHPGIDIVTINGTNIYSAYSGVVVTNSYKFDNGNYLVIKHNNGYHTLYAHLSKKLVNEGDKVSKGQLIGIMGQTGYATGVHLHFAVWEGYPYQSNSVNPLNFY